jgi:hypothetical protein
MLAYGDGREERTAGTEVRAMWRRYEIHCTTVAGGWPAEREHLSLHAMRQRGDGARSLTCRARQAKFSDDFARAAGAQAACAERAEMLFSKPIS